LSSAQFLQLLLVLGEQSLFSRVMLYVFFHVINRYETFTGDNTNFGFQAVALIGFGVLLFARFPPEGSRPLDEQDLLTSAP
jgi:hypothetical protein